MLGIISSYAENSLFPIGNKTICFLRGNKRKRLDIFLSASPPISQFEILDVDTLLALALEVLAEVIYHLPVEVLVVVLILVTFLWKDEHIKTLSCIDEGIDHTDGTCGMHIVVDITRHK